MQTKEEKRAFKVKDVFILIFELFIDFKTYKGFIIFTAGKLPGRERTTSDTDYISHCIIKTANGLLENIL